MEKYWNWNGIEKCYSIVYSIHPLQLGRTTFCFYNGFKSVEFPTSTAHSLGAIFSHSSWQIWFRFFRLVVFVDCKQYFHIYFQTMPQILNWIQFWTLTCPHCSLSFWNVKFLPSFNFFVVVVFSLAEWSRFSCNTAPPTYFAPSIILSDKCP